MLQTKKISSTQNAFVKEVLALRERKGRDNTGTFLIEGHREIQRALKHGWKVNQVIFCPDVITLEQLKGIISADYLTRIDLIEVTRSIYQKLTYRETGINLLATCQAKDFSIEKLQLPKNPLIVVLEGLEKPGNLGAILRTTDAAGVDAVLICNPKTDIFNPNIVRSSLGCLFTQPIAVCSTKSAISWLLTNNIRITAAHLEGADIYHKTDFTQGTCIAFGAENTGLSDEWKTPETQLIKIPMHGEADSLNVSTSVAIVVYEAVRQRLLKKPL